MLSTAGGHGSRIPLRGSGMTGVPFVAIPRVIPHAAKRRCGIHALEGRWSWVPDTASRFRDDGCRDSMKSPHDLGSPERNPEARMADEVRATGACLCGGVRYIVRGALRPVLACH